MIAKKDVEHIAKLARLGISKKEIGKFQKEISLILDYVSQLKKTDTKNVEPISHITGAKNVARKDESQKIDIEKVKKILDEAPETKNGYIKVKTVF